MKQTSFLQYNETKFIKLDECINIYTLASLKYFIDIFKELFKGVLYNKWQIFITISACINRKSDAWLNIIGVYNALRMDIKEATVEMWLSFKIAIVSISKVLSIAKMIELLFICFILMVVPDGVQFILKTLQKLGKYKLILVAFNYNYSSFLSLIEY